MGSARTGGLAQALSAAPARQSLAAHPAAKPGRKICQSRCATISGNGCTFWRCCSADPVIFF